MPIHPSQTMHKFKIRRRGLYSVSSSFYYLLGKKKGSYFYYHNPKMFLKIILKCPYNYFKIDFLPPYFFF
jgi:hypothetical protein